MSSYASSPDRMPSQSQYSLKWNNHQTHVLRAFESLLHQERHVDVTLVCSNSTLKAHKIVLSICSPFFERIFADHPCKHPTVLLNDYRGQEISALIDFMYRGEVRVDRDELPALMHAAESLQIRGLALSEQTTSSPPVTPVTDLCEPATPETGRRPCSADGAAPDDEDCLPAATPRDSPVFAREQQLPHMGHLNFEGCSSPMPRRKQARPRRRSGELVPQDLSRPHPPRSLSPPHVGLPVAVRADERDEDMDMAQDLCMKKEPSKSASPAACLASPAAAAAAAPVKSESEEALSLRGSPAGSLPPLGPEAGPFAELALPAPPTGQCQSGPGAPTSSEYLASLNHLAAQWLPAAAAAASHHAPRRPPRDHQAQRGLVPFAGFPQPDPVAPRSSGFPMEGVPPLGGAAGLFPCSAPLDLHDSFKPETFQGLLMGARLGEQSPKRSRRSRFDHMVRRWSDNHNAPVRPKGQHSAPRGGPPRSWTNNDLTEALTMVWNKKMTTSQASRVFGIPYNSLLMYVRGKYGKSLKLEQLRRDCVAGEVMNSLNNNVKQPSGEPQAQPNARVPSLPNLQPPPPAGPGTEPDPTGFAHHSLMAAQGFYADYPNFPVPVNMVHLMPPSEQLPQPHQAIRGEDLMMPAAADSRSPSPPQPEPRDRATPPSAQSSQPPALLQQNGSD